MLQNYKNGDIEVIDWGCLEYGEAFTRQMTLVDEAISGFAPDRLVFVEHPPVVTIGRSGGKEDLRISKELLHSRGVSFFQTDRGGMATFHGPGQLVAYPIVKLKEKDLHLYLERLLNAVATLLREYGLVPEFKIGEPGVWVNSCKIASVGIAVQKWVTYHGVALNVNTELEAFDLIVPCGHSEEKMTSMKQELGFSLNMVKVKKKLTEVFGKEFGYGNICNAQKKFYKYPDWLIHKAPDAGAIESMEKALQKLKLATVCQSAQCPNLGECFARGTATFMILGTNCTRKCRFCAVDKGFPQEVDQKEPERVAQAVQMLGLKYAVITSVTRDDMPDGGGSQFIRTIEQIRRLCPGVGIEILIPDFRGLLQPLKQVFDARPDVLNHNIETVPRLYPFVRPIAKYRRSLGVLEYASRQGLKVKSGLMLGLGERKKEIIQTLKDLKFAGCMYLTIGQYLAPSKNHFPVARFVPPEEFDELAETARLIGFSGVASGPLVRSSYQADQMFETGQRISKVA
ncbi:MAG: lipoyl synthase [Thermodesulfobacteriota bacterium]|nr:lipoyl synthase [Thermodesulfobacteriota bacterium]